MSRVTQKNNLLIAKILVTSCIIVWMSFLWQGTKGFNLWDEGFLWYGVQRILQGEVPIRDFLAYDPGRYYWSAALISVIGDSGIVSLRWSVAAFQAVGLFAGLYLIAQSENDGVKARAAFWMMSAVTLMAWMFPRHKLFDISLSILLIGALAYLISNPESKRYAVVGVCVGLAAIFGRNHGMYGAAASVGAIAWLNLRQPSGVGLSKGLLLWVAGVCAGFLPVILMLLLIPGFAPAFWESIRFLFEQKATNLTIPVPWPWTVKFAAISTEDAVQALLVGLFFIGTLLFGICSLVWIVLYRNGKIAPAFAASAFLALPYAHFAFSRADVGHLAQGIYPLLLGCLVLLASARASIKWLLGVVLCGASILVMHTYQPAWQCLAGKQCVTIQVSGNDLQVDSTTASDVALLRQLAAQFAPHGQTMIAAPFWPGAYALLERKAPMWEIFPLFPRPADFEAKEIERIKSAKPSFAFVFDLPLDGRDERRFRNTHPMTHQYILDHFEPVSVSPNPAYQIYRARGTAQ